jgi:hypothetical protein
MPLYSNVTCTINLTHFFQQCEYLYIHQMHHLAVIYLLYKFTVSVNCSTQSLLSSCLIMYKALHIVKVNLQNGCADKYEKKHKKFLKI